MADENNEVPAFQPTPTEDIIGKFAVQLVTVEGSTTHAMGTAILVSPHMALTASHIFDQCDKAYGPPIEKDGEKHSSFVMYALQYGNVNNPTSFLIQRVLRPGFTDLAVLVVNGDPAALPVAYPRLCLDPPGVGEPIFAFGYPGSTSLHGGNLQVRANGHTSVGRVLDVYPRGRDRVLAPFPCFRTNARFDDAMSGGPVFNREGQLCGLISANMPPTDEGEDHSSLVTLIWPLMAFEIDVPWRTHPELKRYRLLDFFRSNAGQALGIERIVITDGAVSLIPPK